MSFRIALILLLIPFLSACSENKYEGPDWTLSDEWVSINTDRTPPPYDNTLPLSRRVR